MKIDWNELQSGVASEMDKLAFSLPKFSLPKLGPKGKAVAAGAGLAGAGAAGANAVGGMVNKQVGGALSGMADYLPMLLPFLGGSRASSPTGSPVVHVTTQKPPGMLDLPANQMGSLSSPNLGQSFAKSANLSLAKVIQARLVNQAIDNVSSSTVPQETANPAEAKKIELVSKYPEMAKLLEKEENKAYLEKLLKE
jgi:hypothetical protein